MVRDSAGRALLLALAATATLSVLAAAAARVAADGLKSARMARDRTAALYAAESGLNHALHALRNGERPPSLSSPGWLFSGPASYRVALSYPGTHLRAVDAVADGLAGGSSRRAATRFRLTGLPAAYFEDSLPQGHPDGFVTGACRSALAFPAAAEASPPPEAAPLGATSAGPGVFRKSGNLVVTSTFAVAGPATVYVAGNLRVQSGALLRIGPGVTFFVGGGLTAQPNSVIQAAGPATFYIGGNAEFMNGARLENTLAPGYTQPVDIVVRGGSRIVVAADAALGSGGPPNVVLSLAARDARTPGTVSFGAASLYGGIYAAAATVQVSANARIRGSVVACALECQGGGGGGGGKDKGKQGGRGKGKQGGRGGATCSVAYDLGGSGAVAEPGWYR